MRLSAGGRSDDGGRADGGHGGHGGQATGRGSNQPSASPSSLLGKRAMQERVIVELELEVEALREKCADTYRQEVMDLWSDNAKLIAKGGTKEEMCKSLHYNEVDDRCAGAISKLCKEWLFPRFKFLYDNWMDYTDLRSCQPHRRLL